MLMTVDTNGEPSNLISSGPKTQVNIQSEINSISDRPAWFSERIRKRIEENKGSITKKNCKGLLFDSDGDTYFDSPIFGNTFSDDNTGMVIHYNFCNFLYDQDEVLTLIFTTKNLLDKVDYLGNDGRKYVPTIVYKTDKAGNVISNEEGYVAKEDILTY